MNGTASGRATGKVYGVLAFGVVCVSVAAPLIRAASAPPLAIAAYRLVLGGLPLLAAAVVTCRRELRALSTADRRAVLLSGICLAGHFATWVASLRYGSVASSVALVTISPLFVALFAFFFGAEPISRGMWIAVAVCTAGGLVIGAADWRAGGREVFADFLALSGAGFAAAYYLFGRRVRARLSLLGYAGSVYAVAAFFLAAAVLLSRQPVIGFSEKTYLIFALLAIVPQVLGHTSLNWALGYVSAPFVSVAVLGEPILATILAAVFLGEMPGLARVLGGALLVAGVGVAFIDEQRRDGAASVGPVPAEAG